MKPPGSRRLKNWPKGWLDTPVNAGLTLLMVLILWKAGLPFFKWAVIDAAWAPGQGASPAGANWAYVRENIRFIIFGFYPPQEQWRPLTAMVLLAVTCTVTVLPGVRGGVLAGIWALFLLGAGLLLWGGWGILPPVESTRFSGLPLTLILSVAGLAFSYPLGILLAVARTSRQPGISGLALVYIEFFQGVPLISLLFVSSMLFPLFMPEGITMGKLLRAQIAIVLSSSAYIAEAVRGGLRAVGRGQYEAAQAMGLSPALTLAKVILPQALPIAMPATVNRFITLFKDTSLVIVVSLFDLLKTAQTPLAHPQWMGASLEAYLFAAAVYFLFCFSISRLGRRLEPKNRMGGR